MRVMQDAIIFDTYMSMNFIYLRFRIRAAFPPRIAPTASFSVSNAAWIAL
jgi:hypothetical protein